MKEAIKNILLFFKEHFPLFFLLIITIYIGLNIYIYNYYKNEDDYILQECYFTRGSEVASSNAYFFCKKLVDKKSIVP